MGFKQVTQQTERNSFAGFLVFVQDRARMQPLLFHLIMMISKFNILSWVLVVFKIGQDSAVLIRKKQQGEWYWPGGKRENAERGC
jgi:hypothetical protein